MKTKIYLTLLFFTTQLLAHPVPYKGALGYMTWNQAFLSDTWMTYSFLPDTAMAARFMRMEMKDGSTAKYYAPQLNYLLKRWNEKEYQSNIYLYGGYGALRVDRQDGSAGLVGIEADSESRKYFIMGKYELMSGSFNTNFHSETLRIGVAPYEAEYTEIASWFMIQAQYHPDLSKNFVVTPMLRMFYKSVLWEVGVGLNGDWMLNFMFHL